MNDKPGPGAGAPVAGLFLMLFGLCLTLLGGSCGFMLVAEPETFESARGGYVSFVLTALALLGVGLASFWIGVKLMKGDFSK